MPITPLPTPPNRTDGHAEFVSRANAHVAALSLFTSEANTLEENVNAKEANAVASGNMATASANFKGSWPGLAGSAAIPFSVHHDDNFWMLVEDIADVTLFEPGVSDKWLLIGGVISIVANEAALGIGNVDGESRVTADTGHRWVWDATGEAWTNIDLIFTPRLMHLQDQKSNGSGGGSAVLGFNTRDINTILTNEITGASLSTNYFTIPAGIYDIIALAPCYNVRDNKLFLKKTSDGTTILIGHGEYTRQGSDVAEGAGVDARVIGRFTLAVETELKLSHWMEAASATFGLGSMGHSSEANEVFTDIRIWQRQEGV